MKVSRNIEYKRRVLESYSRAWKSVRNSAFRTVVTIIGVTASILLISIFVTGQSADKTVSFQPSKTFMAPQISTTEVRVGDDVRKVRVTRNGDAFFTAAEDFKEEPDWLSRTSFQLENVSDKPIVYLTINLRFPETTVSGPIMLYPITFGRRPGSNTQNLEPFLLKPRETLDLPLGPKYSDITRFVGHRHSIEFINQIQLEVGFIVFADGTAWTAGSFLRQDPNNPNRYIPVEA